MAITPLTVEVVPRSRSVERPLPVPPAPTPRELPVLESTPIPTDWILDGEPVARSVELTAAGTCQLSSGLWACSAGRFTWHYASDEIIRILNGEARLRFGTHEQVARTGDVVSFRGGDVVEWTVHEYVEKFWVLGPAPSHLTRVRRKLSRAARR
jgi:uncharacterized protein